MNLFFSGKTTVIAEIANSHDGKLELAKKLTDAAAEAGADIIKYQIFRTDELLEPNHEKYDVFKKLEMSPKKWKTLINYAKNKKIKVFVDIFGVKSANLASRLSVDGFKIHSTDITNPSILNFCANVKKPILLSTAGCFEHEIKNALMIIQKLPKEIILMHGFQGYPTKINDLNLLKITKLLKQYNLPVGLMDHISGNSEMAKIIPLLGISLGAIVVEKHLTLNRSEKGTDYYSSLNPNEFKELVSLIRKTERSLGLGSSELLPNEKKYRLEHKKNPVSKKTIRKGTTLYHNLFEYKRTKIKHDSIPFYDFEFKTAKVDISKGKILDSSMVSKTSKIVAVIACRVESGRLYGKPIQNIGNFSILELLINQIKTSNLINDIVLAISETPGNEIFVDFAKKHNLKFIVGDDTDVLDRLIIGAKYVGANIVFRVTSENPFIYWEGIDELIKKHIIDNFDFSFMNNLPIGSGFELINVKALEKSHIMGNKKHRSELCSLYIFEHKQDFKINSSNPPKELAKPQIRLTVDTPQDLLVARIIYERLAINNKPIPLKKIIKLIEKNPTISKINSNIPLAVTRIWD